eukprot:Em0015g500a
MVQVMNPCFAPITVHADVMLQPVVDCAQVQKSVSLAPSVKDRVAALLWRFEDVIGLNDNDLGRTHLVSHRIDKADARPVRQLARRLPFHLHQEVRAWQPSSGSWSTSWLACIGTTCLVYLDDIIIFSKSIEQHIAQLSDVFARLKGAGLKIRPSKGIKTDPAKIACVANWPVPESLNITNPVT